jgi:hypothetical protein
MVPWRLGAPLTLVSPTPGTLAGCLRTKPLAARLARTWNKGLFASVAETSRFHFEAQE